LAINERGERLAVFAGGFDRNDETDIVMLFNYDIGLWEPVPQLPYPEAHATAIQYQNSFLFIGPREILFFNPDNGGSWDSTDFRFDPSFDYFEVDAAATVPRSYLDCN